MKKIECIIMDWAGTAVDYGCFAPVAAFASSFDSMGVDVNTKQIRSHMGLTKVEEVRALFGEDSAKESFQKKYGRESGEEDVQKCYSEFQNVLFASLRDYTDPLPGVVETIEKLRSQGIKIGSTSGYTKAMMEVVIPEAEKKGYHVDDCVTSDNLPAGRPWPYMIFKNMIDMKISSVQSVVKVGDTVADVREGVNAGAWSVGTIMGSNELGLTLQEAEAMSQEELSRRKEEVRLRLLGAGAHYVIDSIADLPGVINDINERMARL
jgi:phosphonoacetaldehyde hydrolase